ncbi:flavin-dependent dehydrogenase [Pleurocapsa sp. PCC 7327]|uniref:NAD(P)/FAD-dependent oxidoreductase n=1 Tax=Pleurocapsa sp. PCC 7327 TaxID=118163 RepID=UPI00029FABA8|nr:NAD(P)/FAD-dependent oxidoreductase [Pleurocapsa sp. PCC 7327]AFY79397.1 flavin-dependent dehydrogenase [Pleurocapsa sp. PCC 7327]
MKEFDVVIVGAGPAGCYCARLLAKSNYQVLLIEQCEHFYQNNFSSAATPLETLEKFNLPQDVVASFWQNLTIVTSKVSQNWESQKTLGAVLDFAKLREFLAKEVERNGGEVWLGHRYLKSWQEAEKTVVSIKPKNSDAIAVSTKVLVDATGYARAVMYEKKRDRPKFLKGTGIEYLIEVSNRDYEKYSNFLVFFMGYKWIPKGYSWIFPMNNNQLKVGSAWLEQPHKFIDRVKPLKEYIYLIFKEYIQLERYKIVDIHGSILEYSIGLNDRYFRDNIIAIGDAVSTVNFLGGEGIRHAMKGAEIANEYIQEYLKGKIENFQGYQKSMHKYFVYKWNISARISRRVYLEYPDEKIDRRVAALKYLSVEDMMEILFNYKFEKVTNLLRHYSTVKIERVLNAIKSAIASLIGAISFSKARE